MILVNFSNQVAAGPRNISVNFIRQALSDNSAGEFCFIIPDIEGYRDFVSTSRVVFHKIKTNPGNLRALFNVFWVNYFLMPRLYRKYRVTAVLAFGSFLCSRALKVKKVVLLHHPYLVDDSLYTSIKGIAKISEWIKRIIFNVTVSNADSIVVQSDYMKDAFCLKHPDSRDKLQIIFNPISANFLTSEPADRVCQARDNKNIIYVSRFYPHKNHDFLLALSQRIIEEKSELSIYVTINPDLPGAEEFLNKVSRDKSPITNIGEVPQQELCDWYTKMDICIFPSRSETFGNPLIEAMLYALPVVAPEKEYSCSILGEAGVYYIEDDVNECYDKLLRLSNDVSFYQRHSNLSKDRSNLFPTAGIWFGQYMTLLSENVSSN